MAHPRENWNPVTRTRVYTRRDFLQRAALLGIALPALPSLLAACADREAADTVELAIGTPQSPVQQPLFDDNPAIDSGLPQESGPLKIYNWDAYINPDIIPVAQDALGVDIEITTFFNEEEALRKLSSDEVRFDVWFPSAERVPVSIAGELIQPLNLDYVPNLEKYVWPRLADPYYDKGSRYTVPYVLWHTGIGWRTDMVDSADIEGQANAWDVFWNSKYKGITGLYDSFLDTIQVALYRNGVKEPQDATADQLTAAGDSLIELIDLMDIKYRIDGAYQGIPEGQFGLHLAWSGDMINSQYYWPSEAEDQSVTRYAWPAKIEGSQVNGTISNDTMTIPKNAEHPVLAHNFLNFMLDETNALDNFGWVGYQPPQIGLDPDYLVADEWVPEYLASAIVTEDDFSLPNAWVARQLTVDTEAAWQEQWDRANSGG
ncbi:MAG: extracellular solute-binding protein [Acidimicrobiia bacterium]